VTTDEPLTIGNSGTGCARFDGRIDEVSLYARMLSQAEMQAIVAAGSFGKCTAEPPACDDGIDNDGDGRIDFEEPQCGYCEAYWPYDFASFYCDATETASWVACDDAIDNDGDGLVDTADPGCVGPRDGSERSPIAACDDGVDQDGDTLVDFPADPDCSDAADPVEGPDVAACQNGVDDDGDGAVDAADPSCADPADPEEFVLLDDGASHVADAGTSYANESVRVADGVTPTALEIATGGAVGHRLVVGGGSSLQVGGGSIGGDLLARDQATVAISAGALGGAIRSTGQASVVLTGGTLGATLEASDTSSIVIHVAQAPAGGSGALDPVAGTITGALADGTPYSFTYLRDASATIELVPEPAPLLGALTCLAALASLERRSRMRAGAGRS